jgi:hypothetical protein
MEDATGTWSPQTLSSLSRTSSTLTTLTQFWKEDSEAGGAQDYNRSQEAKRNNNHNRHFWVDSLPLNGHS